MRRGADDVTAAIQKTIDQLTGGGSLHEKPSEAVVVEEDATPEDVASDSDDERRRHRDRGDSAQLVTVSAGVLGSLDDARPGRMLPDSARPPYQRLDKPHPL